MTLTPSQKEAKDKILVYLTMETRGGCFYLIGEHLSGKTFLLTSLSKELFREEKSFNFNLAVSKWAMEHPEYPKLAKVNSPKLTNLVRTFIQNLLNTEGNYHKAILDGQRKNILLIDSLEILYEYDVDFVNLFDSLSFRKKNFEKKIILSIPGTVSSNKIYAFGKLVYKIPEFSREFWVKLKKEEL